MQHNDIHRSMTGGEGVLSGQRVATGHPARGVTMVDPGSDEAASGIIGSLNRKAHREFLGATSVRLELADRAVQTVVSR